MLAFTPFAAQIRSPFLGQSPAPVGSQHQGDSLVQLTALQTEISSLLDKIPRGSVASPIVDSIQKKLEQCRNLGPTPDAITCLISIKADLQAVSEARKPTPVWPWIVGGLAVAGAAGWLIFGR